MYWPPAPPPSQCAGHNALFGHGGVGHNGDFFAPSRPACISKSAMAPTAHRHINDDNGGCSCNGPNQAIRACPCRPNDRNKSHGMVDLSMGNRNARIAQPANTSRNAGNKAKRNLRLHQGLGFFAAAPKTNGSPPLSRKTRFFLAPANKLARNIFLTQRGFAAALARINQARPRCVSATKYLRSPARHRPHNRLAEAH